MLSEHDGNLLVSLPAGEVEWSAPFLGPCLHVGRTGEEKLGQLCEPLLSSQGQRALTAIGERGDGVTAVVKEKLDDVNVVLTASLKPEKIHTFTHYRRNLLFRIHTSTVFCTGVHCGENHTHCYNYHKITCSGQYHIHVENPE